MPRYIRSQIQERSARRRFVADVLAKAGIRTGSIVRCLQDGHLYVVVKPMTHRLHMRRLENNWTKSVGTPHPDSPDASMGVKLVCNPPDGWIHPFAVQPRTVRGPGCDFTAACRDLRKYVNERLAENDRRKSDYGVLWRTSAVEPHVKAFDEAYERREQSWDHLPMY